MDLKDIVEYLNQNYNQESKKYSIVNGAKLEVIKLDEHTAISFWGCGAIVCKESTLSFISEDDGNWFIEDNGKQSSFSIGWGKGFAEAMNKLIKYVEENGKPVYYVGVEPKRICHYKL